MQTIEGIVPVMLTPFHHDGSIDYEGLERLIEWYIANGADALFAVCQSSEMQFLSLEERASLAQFVVEKTNGRVPVIASGHVSDSPSDQLAELLAMHESGVETLVLITNRLDPDNMGEDTFIANFNWLSDRLPESAGLGLYECPAPYRRLLSDTELAYCASQERVRMLKDVCCDLSTLKRRLQIVEGSNLNIINANAAIAFEAMQAGSKGFSGVFTNIHPELYAWLYQQRSSPSSLTRELSAFLTMAAVSENLGYPAMAKLYHQNMGTFKSIYCRAIDYDITERYWALEPILDKLRFGTEAYRKKIHTT